MRINLTFRNITLKLRSKRMSSVYCEKCGIGAECVCAKKKKEVSAVASNDGVRPGANAKQKEIYGRRLLDITVGIDHLRSRPEYKDVKNNLDKAIGLIFEAIDEVRK
jgi:hypothetical protein